MYADNHSQKQTNKGMLSTWVIMLLARIAIHLGLPKFINMHYAIGQIYTAE